MGFVATLLTQSSSAAIAIILTAAAGGMVGIEAAAAAVIGANIGTTSTAALAVIKATPSAKRLALGHIAFNVITGVVAWLLLPALLWLVAALAHRLGTEGRPAISLALFLACRCREASHVGENSGGATGESRPSAAQSRPGECH